MNGEAMPLIGGLLLLVLAAATLWRPELTVPVLLFGLYSRLFDALGWYLGPVTVIQALVMLFLGAMLLHRLVLRREGLVWDRTVLWMLVYAGTIALSAVAAYDRSVTLAGLVTYLREIVIVIVLLNLVTTPGGLRRAVWTIVASGIFLAAAAALHRAAGWDLGGFAGAEWSGIAGGESGPRLTGPVGDSNFFAQLLVPILSLAIYRAWGERVLGLRLVGFGAATAVGLTIVWTYSRGGFLALLVVLTVVMVYQRRRPARLLVLGLVVVPLVLGAPHLYWDRVSAIARHAGEAVPVLSAGGGSAGQPGDTPTAPTTPGPRVRQGNTQDRTRLMLVGALIFGDHLPTGVGRGNFYALYPDYYRRVDPTMSPGPMGPHNTLIHVAAETGLVGLAAFVATVVLAVLGVRAAKRDLAAAGREREALLLESIEVALYGYLVTSMFLNDNIYQRYLWLLIALAAIGRQVTIGALREPKAGRAPEPEVAAAPVGPAALEMEGAR